MWYNPIPRNFTSEMPASVDFYVSPTSSFEAVSSCVSADCVKLNGGQLFGTALDIPLFQTTYDFRTELFSVQNSGMEPGLVVTAIVNVLRPSFLVVDEFLVNY
jgi:hypothetical protein